MRITGMLLALICSVYPIQVLAEEARDADLAALIKTYRAECQEYRNSDDRDPAQSPWRLYPAKFMDFARAKDDDASLRACEFVILNFYISPSRYDAMELAFTQHRKKKLFAQFVANLVYKEELDTKVDSHLANLAESEDSTVKWIALYHQARLISAVATGLVTNLHGMTMFYPPRLSMTCDPARHSGGRGSSSVASSSSTQKSSTCKIQKSLSLPGRKKIYLH